MTRVYLLRATAVGPAGCGRCVRAGQAHQDPRTAGIPADDIFLYTPRGYDRVSPMLDPARQSQAARH